MSPGGSAPSGPQPFPPQAPQFAQHAPGRWRGPQPAAWLAAIATGFGAYIVALLLTLAFGAMAVAGIAQGAGAGSTQDAVDDVGGLSNEFGSDAMPSVSRLLVMVTSGVFLGPVSLHGGAGAASFRVGVLIPVLTVSIIVFCMIFFAGRLAERRLPSATSGHRLLLSAVTAAALLLPVLFIPLMTAVHTMDGSSGLSFTITGLSFRAVAFAFLFAFVLTAIGRETTAGNSRLRSSALVMEIARCAGVVITHVLLIGAVCSAGFIIVGIKQGMFGPALLLVPWIYGYAAIAGLSLIHFGGLSVSVFGNSTDLSALLGDWNHPTFSVFSPNGWLWSIALGAALILIVWMGLRRAMSVNPRTGGAGWAILPRCTSSPARCRCGLPMRA